MGPKWPFPSDSQTSFKVAVAGDGRGIRLVRGLLLLLQLTLIGRTSASKYRITTCHQNLLDNPGLWRCDWKSEGDFCISIGKREKVTVCLPRNQRSVVYRALLDFKEYFHRNCFSFL